MPICSRCGTGYDSGLLSCPNCGRVGSRGASFFGARHSPIARFSLQIALLIAWLGLVLNVGAGIYCIVTGDLVTGLIALFVGTPYLYAQAVVFSHVSERL